MKAHPLLSAKPPSTGTVWFILIVALATMAGMLCEWRAPGLGRYAEDSLMRARGTLAVPQADCSKMSGNRRNTYNHYFTTHSKENRFKNFNRSL